MIYQRASSTAVAFSPTPYDRVIAERLHVPAREGRAVRVEAGRRFRVIDPDGGQVADTWAFVGDDPAEFHSAQHTRVHVNRLFPRPGEEFVTNARRPILLLEEDATPGIHDMLCAACDPERYRGLGVEGPHASCQENLRTALQAVGVDAPRFAPQPINLFMNTPAQPDATIAWLPAPTKAGDYVLLRAELDIVLVVSACPQDIIQINERNPGPIAIELL
ncbi:MAG: urea carboxylase-associated family protein [Actinobacteria bacterium]|nr:MAG: urea carboxylase-associated family protein [Actinomycetota bacterium]